MRGMALAIMALVAPLVLTGCIGSDGDGAVGPTGGAAGTRADHEGPRQPAVRIAELNGTFTAEAVNAGADDTPRMVSARNVSTDATAIVAELRWEGTADLDLHLLGPSFCPDGRGPTGLAEGFACVIACFATGEAGGAYGPNRASPSVQDPYLRVEVDQATISSEMCGAEACDWAGFVNPNVAVDTRFEMAVTVFDGVRPPEGYSAFGQGDPGQPSSPWTVRSSTSDLA